MSEGLPSGGAILKVEWPLLLECCAPQANPERLGALLGPAALVSVVIYGGLVGGVISVVMLARRHELQRSMSDILHNPFNLRRGGAKAPYGVAIASGVYLSTLLPSVIG